MTKQKQYEQDQQLKRLQEEMSHSRGAKLLNPVQTIMEDSGAPVLKRSRLSDNGKDADKPQGKPPTQVQSQGTSAQSADVQSPSGSKIAQTGHETNSARSVSDTSAGKSNGVTEEKPAAQRSPPPSWKVFTNTSNSPVSKQAQRLQRQRERREKFIKKHEDLLNQVRDF